MADVAAELGAIVARLPPGCPRPPVVAYGHYPLSTVDAPAGMAGVRGLVSHLARSVHSMQVGGAQQFSAAPSAAWGWCLEARLGST